MRKSVMALLAAILSFCMAVTVFAADPAADECVAKCKAAVALIAEKGEEAAIAEINKKDGQFVSDVTFVILFDFNGVVKAHGMKPDTIGKNRMEDKDSQGKAYYKEYVEVAKTKGEGWVDHMWVSPDKKEFPKKTYVMKVEGKELAVAAGFSSLKR
jgi:signal transduction histidine kinase